MLQRNGAYSLDATSGYWVTMQRSSCPIWHGKVSRPLRSRWVSRDFAYHEG